MPLTSGTRIESGWPSTPPVRSRRETGDARSPARTGRSRNRSCHDRENDDYFADGLSEELLNVLARVRGLRVASRTSAFYFKGKDVDLATVVRKLNVATILERAGDDHAWGRARRVVADEEPVIRDWRHRFARLAERDADVQDARRLRGGDERAKPNEQR